MARRRKNPLEPTSEQLEAYPREHYVGTVIAPKSRVPMAVYVSSSGFRGFSPDRKVTMGGGYFGGDGPEDCERQHMAPGLADRGDAGTGIGTALYLAGNMVVAAAVEHGRRNFPYRIEAGEPCTFSRGDDRSSDADRAWSNMVRHGLADQTEGEQETEEVEERYDVDDLIDEDYVTQHFMAVHEVEEVTDVSFRGYIDVTGWKYGDPMTVEIMYWESIKDTGLVLHLGKYFDDDPGDRMAVPPEVFAKVDWRHTRDNQIVEFARQNMGAAGTQGEEWIRETACHFGRGTHRSNLLLDIIGEGPQLHLPGVASNPEVCPVTFAAESRTWMARFGPSFTETNPRRRRVRPVQEPERKKRLIKNRLMRS